MLITLDIKVYETGDKESNNMAKFAEYCRSTLKKRGILFSSTYCGATIKGNKNALFKILDELNKISIPIKIMKKADFEEIIIN